MRNLQVKLFVSIFVASKLMMKFIGRAAVGSALKRFAAATTAAADYDRYQI